VEINIDLKPLEPKDGVSEADHVCASTRFPNGETGVIVFAKAAMPQNAPQDAKAYEQFDPRFPHHSTADQFFNEKTFEAYRGLGAHAARGCVSMLNAYRTAQGYPAFPLPIPDPPSEDEKKERGA
jgi:hypothetical protein